MKLKLFFVMMTALFFLPGCGEKLPPGMEKLYPTKVVVKYSDGTPVDNAQVTLHAENTASGGKVWSHGASTDSQGQAVLFSDGIYKGVPVGQYKVVVSKIIIEGEDAPAPKLSPEESAADIPTSRSAKKPERVAVVADQYGKVESTPLTATVEAKKENVITLDVGEKARIPKPLTPLMR